MINIKKKENADKYIFFTPSLVIGTTWSTLDSCCRISSIKLLVDLCLSKMMCPSFIPSIEIVKICAILQKFVNVLINTLKIYLMLSRPKRRGVQILDNNSHLSRVAKFNRNLILPTIKSRFDLR